MKKTVLEMFEDIKELEVADYPPLTIAEVVPFKCNKVEKSLKALEIIKEKNVDVNYLIYNTFHDYNCHILTRDGLDTKNQLTQEEFNLLNEVLE